VAIVQPVKKENWLPKSEVRPADIMMRPVGKFRRKDWEIMPGLPDQRRGKIQSS